MKENNKLAQGQAQNVQMDQMIHQVQLINQYGYAFANSRRYTVKLDCSSIQDILMLLDVNLGVKSQELWTVYNDMPTYRSKIMCQVGKAQWKIYTKVDRSILDDMGIAHK